VLGNKVSDVVFGSCHKYRCLESDTQGPNNTVLWKLHINIGRQSVWCSENDDFIEKEVGGSYAGKL